MEVFNLSMDASEIQKLLAVLKMYPKETQKASAQYLNDQARLFKDLAPKVLATKYTLRNKPFVHSQFRIDKASTSEKIGSQKASVYTSDHYGRFSGWEEELTGGARPQRSTGEGHYHRLIWNTARGGNPDAQVKGQFRLRAGGAGYNSDIIPDSRQYGMPIPQFLAMLSKSTAPKKVKNEFDYYVFANGKKRKKHFKEYTEPKRLLGKNKVFILGGAGWPLGLYRFKDMEGTTHPEVEALQHFRETPIRAEKFDWRQIVEDKVRFWFSPDKVWDTYFAPILEKLRTK